MQTLSSTRTPTSSHLPHPFLRGGREALQQAGYKLTTPRLTVLNILEQQGGHLTAAELIALVEQETDSIGRATIFRTLDLFVQLGIVGKTTQGGSIASYILMAGGHHHHLICTHCQQVIEFPDCELSPLLKLLETRLGFHVESHLLEVYGICQHCQQLAVSASVPDSEPED